jgi:hypothetical protein
VYNIQEGNTNVKINLYMGGAIKRSGDAVCGLQRARGDEEHGFLG